MLFYQLLHYIIIGITVPNTSLTEIFDTLLQLG